MHDKLTDLLKGAQRVPTLLLHSPQQPLSDLNLENYNVLECEPLHDIKGHIQNVLSVLPEILDKETAAHLSDILDADLKKDPKTGADYRLAIIHVYAMLRQTSIDPNIVKLLETIVLISEILYSNDSKRTPRQILQLYNTTWLQHELCSHLFHTPKAISRGKLFGSYLHSLTNHAAQQYEIICMKSTNTEHEERLFGQAKRIALQATNRKPNTVIPNILLRLQAKQQTREMYSSLKITSTHIGKEANKLEFTQNTTITTAFIRSRISSWQAHLQRLSLYLVHGEGIWWHKTETGYEFHDGPQSPDFQHQGPPLAHFRHSSIKELEEKKATAWQQVLSDNITLPTPYIKLFSEAGDFIAYRYFDDQDTEQTDTGTPIINDETQTEETVGPFSPDHQDRQEIAEGSHELPMDILLDTQGHSEEAHVQDTNQEEAVRIQTGEELFQEDSDKVVALADTYKYKTKFANHIHKALNNVTGILQEQLIELDTLRDSIKTKTKKPSQQTIQKYKRFLAAMKEHVCIRKSELKRSIKHFENEYYMSHQKLPDIDSDDHYRGLAKSYKSVYRLLQLWDEF